MSLYKELEKEIKSLLNKQVFLKKTYLLLHQIEKI